MLRACLALLAGSFALQLSSFSLAVSLIVIACVTFAACRSWRLIGAFFAGVLLFAGAASTVIDQRLPHKFEGDSMLATVRVVDYPTLSSGAVSFVVDAIDDQRLSGRLRVSWHEPSVSPRLGDIWQLELRLRRPRGSLNPGGFDSESWMFRERISATGYVVPGRRNLLLASRQLSAIENFRARLIERISGAVADPGVAAVIVAIAVGARHLLAAGQWDRYAITGTSHLMAISGLHIGLAALAAFTLFNAGLALCGIRRNNYRLAMLLSLLVAAAYVALSGLAVPAQRAMLMLTLATMIVARQRQLQASRVVAGAAAAIVVVDPLATMTPGFRLSFAAVIVLLWIGQHRQPGGRLSGVRQLASMQLVLMLGLLPITVLVFQRVAIVAPIVNFVAVPLFSALTVPATLVAAAGGHDIFLQIAASSIVWLERLIEWAAAVPGADTTIAAITPRAAPLLILPLIWVLLPPGWPGRAVAWLALLALLLHRPAAPPFSCADLSFMDVGQGLAVVVRSHRHTMLYDTGPAYRSGGSALQRSILPFLRAERIERLDMLVASHADLDHAGGVNPAMRSLQVADLVSGEPLPDVPYPARRCNRGERWSWDGVELRFLHPPDSGFSGNDASCVLLLSAGRNRALLTGDVEAAAEQSLIRGGMLPAADIVSVPHHGSLTSSSVPFTTRIAPGFAVVSAGFGNRWGFPKEDVVARWRNAGAEVLRTDTSGAIRLRICQRSGVRILRREREYRRRLWHEP